MDTKIGASLPVRKGAPIRATSAKTTARTNDASQMKKAFGDKNLGDILNQVADPNYTSNKRKVRGVGNDELGKDAFFKLMLTQLKQQDPTNPLKSHEMAAQLAQFSSVEQLANMNETLKSMAQNKKDQFEILSMIGKVVSGDSAKIERVKGDIDHKIEFNIPRAADTVVVKIKNDKGKTVRTYDLQNLKKGKNQILCNGMHDEGKDAVVGKYTAEILANSQGQKLQVDTRFSGPVEGVQFAKGGPLIVVGGKTMPLKDVQRVEVAKPQQKAVQQNIKVLNPNTKQPKGAIEKPQMASLENVKMNNDLRAKLVK